MNNFKNIILALIIGFSSKINALEVGTNVAGLPVVTLSDQLISNQLILYYSTNGFTDIVLISKQISLTSEGNAILTITFNYKPPQDSITHKVVNAIMCEYNSSQNKYIANGNAFCCDSENCQILNCTVQGTECSACSARDPLLKSSCTRNPDIVNTYTWGNLFIISINNFNNWLRS
jgi:hypothetical protein